MTGYTSRMTEFLGSFSDYAQIGVVILLGLLLTWMELFIYRHLLPRFQKTERVWDDSILKAVHYPLLFLIWFLVLSWVWRWAVLLCFGRPIISDWAMVYRIFFILFIFTVLQFYISNLQHSIIAKSNQKPDFQVNKTTVSAVCMLMRVVIIIMVSLIIMQSLGIKMSALLAFGGASTLVVGLAAKDTLANFFGGFMIFVDRPFEVGDWIASPDRQIEGTVEHIGWRLTCIRAFDKRPMYVPNGLFSTIILNNPSRMSNRRIKTTIGVRYDDLNVLAPMLADIERMLKEHPEIDQSQATFVKWVEFGASSLNFLVYAFTKTTEWVKYQAIQQDIFLRIMDIIAQHGAQCAFPTQTLELPKDVAISLSQPANR